MMMYFDKSPGWYALHASGYGMIFGGICALIITVLATIYNTLPSITVAQQYLNYITCFVGIGLLAFPIGLIIFPVIISAMVYCVELAVDWLRGGSSK